MELKILSHNGDDRLVWDKRFPDQMKEAQAKFYELIKKGYTIFAVNKDGSRSHRKLFRFEPDAEELLAVPMITGG